MEDLLQALKAVSEPTRLRIVVLLSRTELTVGELCRALGQSQPRVSRHLRLLCEAGLLDRNAQGTSAYYRPSRTGSGRELFDAVLPLIDEDEPALRRDLGRLETIREERAAVAAEYFERVAADWDEMRGLHVSDVDVEQAMLEAVDDLPIRDLLDVGTGTGRVLEVFADRIEQGIGVDLSRQMLNLARSRLDQQGLSNCAVRHGNVYDLTIDAGSMDVAVLHHVLHFLDDPSAAIHEAGRVLRPNGALLIVDFGPHGYDRMQADYAHRWLGFSDEEIIGWAEAAGLTDVTASHLVHQSESGREPLTVTLWVARQRPDAPAVYPLGAAS